METNSVTAIAELAARAAQPIARNRADGTEILVWPDKTVTELSTTRPATKTGGATVDDLDSFIGYVAKHREPGTLIALRWAGPVLTAHAVLDHHDGSDQAMHASATAAMAESRAGWGRHQCTGRLAPTDGWAAWLASDRKDFSQVLFAEWLEDRIAEIRKPSAGELLDIVTTLETSASASFKSAVRLKNGDREFAFKYASEARAGQDGTLVIPDKFTLEVRPYAGAESVAVIARLKYRTGSDGLKFRYEIEGLDELRTHLLEALRGTIGEKLAGVLVVLGAVTPNARG